MFNHITKFQAEKQREVIFGVRLPHNIIGDSCHGYINNKKIKTDYFM